MIDRHDQLTEKFVEILSVLDDDATPDALEISDMMLKMADAALEVAAELVGTQSPAEEDLEDMKIARFRERMAAEIRDMKTFV